MSFAKLVGKTQGAVSKRLRRGDWLWEDKVLVVEAATGVSRFALHPLIYPIETPATATGGAPEVEQRPSASGAHPSDMSRKGLDTPPPAPTSTGGGSPSPSSGMNPADPSTGVLADSPVEGCVSGWQP